MSYLGDFVGTETIPIPITTNDGSGGRVEPNTAFEVADIRVYKGVSATQRSSEAGYAIAAAFDSMVGVQLFSVDLSDDTDAGFFAAGNDYTVVLYPDETVDSQNISRIIAQFSIQNRFMRGTDSAATSSALTTHDNKIGTIENLGSGANVGKNLRDIAGATFATGTDSNEAIRNNQGAPLTSQQTRDAMNLDPSTISYGDLSTLSIDRIIRRTRTMLPSDDTGTTGGGLSTITRNEPDGGDALITITYTNSTGTSVEY